jgi:hypothetical protein
LHQKDTLQTLVCVWLVYYSLLKLTRVLCNAGVALDVSFRVRISYTCPYCMNNE